MIFHSDISWELPGWYLTGLNAWLRRTWDSDGAFLRFKRKRHWRQ